MKNLSVEVKLPLVIIKVNDISVPVPSMILSTLLACFLITFVPQLMPLWMDSSK